MMTTFVRATWAPHNLDAGRGRVALAVVVAGLSVVVAACATPTPPKELVEARSSYQEASAGATMRVNPAGVDTARDRLTVAEDSFREEPRSQDTRDKAYLADRAARLAIAQANTKLAAEQQSESQKALGVVAQKTRADLDKTKQDLAMQQQKGTMTEKQLAEQRLAAANATAAAASATAAAADAQAGLASTKEELAAEKAARVAAEAKAKTALENLAQMAAVKEEARGLVITLSGQVLFASGKSQLLPAAQKALDNVADALKANPDRNIIVEGYTDSVGQRSFNDTLSQDRANSVRLYLIDRGIPSEIITARGFGPDKPVATNDTAEGRANNRRVEIVVSPAERK